MLQDQLLKGIESGKINGARQEREEADFNRALKAGEMPRLHPFVFTTDYNPGDISALLQSGGVELLDVKTLLALREFESVVRWGLSRLERNHKLSDALIVPNLGQDITFFCDPATRQLRESYEIYLQALARPPKASLKAERSTIDGWTVAGLKARLAQLLGIGSSEPNPSKVSMSTWLGPAVSSTQIGDP